VRHLSPNLVREIVCVQGGATGATGIGRQRVHGPPRGGCAPPPADAMLVGDHLPSAQTATWMHRTTADYVRASTVPKREVLCIHIHRKREVLCIHMAFAASTLLLCWVRPYLAESTTSRPICEVKQPQAASVLRSVMTREPAVSYSQNIFRTVPGSPHGHFGAHVRGLVGVFGYYTGYAAYGAF
jgi:hypothetical protein